SVVVAARAEDDLVPARHGGTSPALAERAGRTRGAGGLRGRRGGEVRRDGLLRNPLERHVDELHDPRGGMRGEARVGLVELERFALAPSAPERLEQVGRV